MLPFEELAPGLKRIINELPTSEELQKRIENALEYVRFVQSDYTLLPKEREIAKMVEHYLLG